MIPKHELSTYKQLFREVFSESLEFCDKIFSHRLDTVFDKRENGSIVSFLYAIPFAAKVKGRPCRAIYVYGVGTVPEARGKGYMKEVFQKMEAFYNDTVDFYYLVPASESLFSLYETLGYKTGFYLKKELLFSKRNPDLAYDIKEAPEEFHKDYLAYLEQFDTAIIRTEEDNRFYLSEGNYYKIGNSGFLLLKENNTLYLREMFLDKEAELDCFLDFLAQKGTDSVILTRPEAKTPYAMVKPVSPFVKNADFSIGYTNLNFD
ncbi:MAG: GNAT family N-acetyltransferase [Clostridia bacterium]|nr:GNAT family N-acetyltransferase [Clostridia bacterium]